MKFFADGRAANLIAAFEDQRLEPGFGQIESSDQPIVAAADDYDVAKARHYAVTSSGRASRLRRADSRGRLSPREFLLCIKRRPRYLSKLPAPPAFPGPPRG